MGTEPGAHLVLAGNPLTTQRFGAVRFGADAAHMANITLQHPVRVAIPARYIDGTV